MSQTIKTPAPAPKPWSTPRLNRLGTIADVAAQNNVITVQNAAKS
jgi:hypothetical protein